MIEGDKVICIHDIDNVYDNKYASISDDGVIKLLIDE